MRMSAMVRYDSPALGGGYGVGRWPAASKNVGGVSNNTAAS